MNNKKQLIYFQGAGLVSALGCGLKQNLQQLQKPPKAPLVVEVDCDNQWLKLPFLGVETPSIYDVDLRINGIMIQAVAEALDNSGLSKSQIKNMGLFLGSTSFEVFVTEQSCDQGGSAAISKSLGTLDYLCDRLAEHFSIEGCVFTFNTACTSSANALLYAAEAIRKGQIEHALVVGVEFFNITSLLGFWGLDLISKKGMKPFSSQRDGLCLGEGCGAIVLSTRKTEHKFANLGGENVGDNYSISACNSDGSSIKKVVDLALKSAKLKPEQISLVKAHGTASLSNDEAEIAGLNLVFQQLPPVTVLKPWIGHTLGACGIIELILFYQTMISKRDRPTELLIESGKSSLSELALVNPNQYPSSIDEGYYLLNYFGFGGNNTAIIIGNVE